MPSAPRTSVSRAVFVAAALAAGLALAVAFAAEWWGGLVPCALCLAERWPYRVAIALALLGLVLPAGLRRVALVLVLLAGLGAVATAGVHVGVELGLWPSPLPECAAPRLGAGSIADRLRNMPAHPSKPCDDPVYPIDALPISFAQANLLYALAFTIGIAGALTPRRRR
ncbi:MAG: disulfide bond formation protein B [Alphaproteobacteria bacterium]|nr:disulfide bond formation protein B [Alphaproteobacteria bacterium]